MVLVTEKKYDFFVGGRGVACGGFKGLSEAMAAHYPLDESGQTWRLKMEKLELTGGLWIWVCFCCFFTGTPAKMWFSCRFLFFGFGVGGAGVRD